MDISMEEFVQDDLGNVNILSRWCPYQAWLESILSLRKEAFINLIEVRLGYREETLSFMASKDCVHFSWKLF